MGPDYDFQLARDRRLKGNGIKGLVALGMVLVALVIVVFSANGIVSASLALFRRMTG
jgi:hypothetical protein